MNDILKWLQQWYFKHCNGDWEHSQGITIATIDNPGWSIIIDLHETTLSEQIFDVISFHRDKYDWIDCSVIDNKFIGYCSPLNLFELIEIFAKWVINNHEVYDIFVAIEHDDIDTIKEIITISPEQIERIDGDWNGFTPLYYAVAKGKMEIIKFLLANNANVNSRDSKSGWSPIYPAVCNDEITELLLSYGASVNLIDKNKQTPLHFAVKQNVNNCLENVLKLLLDNKAKLNAIDKDGNTPLHVAILNKQLRAVKFLLKCGADDTLPNNAGITPKQMAVDNQ